MQKLFQYILMTVAMVAMASCSQDEVLTPSAEVQDIRIVVSDFPAFDDAQTRAIGTFDSGKTAWVPNDVIYIVAANAGLDSQILTLTYGADAQWTADETAIHYLSASDTHIRAIYAPNCEKEGTEIMAKDNLPFGTGEFFEQHCNIVDGTLTVDFTNYERPYSRLRIVTEPNEQIAVTATMFDPAGYYDSGTYDYTLTADENGNAYLYGSFAVNGTVTVKNGDEELKNYTFSAATVDAESYVLDAVVDSPDAEYVASTDSESAGTFLVYNAKGLQLVNDWMNSETNDGAGILHIEDAAALTLLVRRNEQNITLKADIDMPAVSEGKSNWTYIGIWDAPYAGTFDGGRYTITGLTIDASADDYPQSYQQAGLFGILEGVVQNVNFADVTVQGAYDIGVVAGHNYGIIKGCNLTGCAVSGAMYIGGVVGTNTDGGTISRCMVDATSAVTDNGGHSGAYVGGIVGNNNGNVLACICYADVALTSVGDYQSLGGIVGNHGDGAVVACGFAGILSYLPESTDLDCGGVIGTKGWDGALYGSWTLGGYPLVSEDFSSTTPVGCFAYESLASTSADDVTVMNAAIDVYNGGKVSTDVDYAAKWNSNIFDLIVER